MIAILSWGSLIWKPQDLPYEGAWKQGGPALPVEFTRVKTARPLTLVLDPVNGVDCPTRFAWSSRTNLADAIQDLQSRENASLEETGYIDLQQNLSSVRDHPEQINIDRIVRQWCHKQQITAAVWTAIPPNFKDELGVDFSVEAAMQYFEQLPKPDQDSVMEYIQNTPSEITTPFRQHVEARWMMR
ncbi:MULTISPECIES: hypothetical protein [unclassified Leptolyngbya]|uniref:hypothetical protein n=1 Tax=unclassified Leptolyngbya TaxID=2650499 RepID=UPI0016861E25|nr:MULTISPECIES: hypothetical protein [unclassified Leptolyngbya]MBD1912845.1 hypothetical protein [Leptolyngbya sp. FACHB-8]MBD2153121.1 hypothetical protein [Leptolyngbya sp. FACHB-16]